MRIRRHNPPPGADLGNRRLLIPLLAPTGGSGRSTVAALLAQATARRARTLVLDGGHQGASPWPAWLTRPAPSPVPTDANPSAQQLFAACSAMRAPDGAAVQVLTSAATHAQPHRDTPPIGTAAGRRFVDLLGHPVVVVDTDTDLLRTSRPDWRNGEEAATGDWLQHPEAAPVLCVAASPKGVADAAVVVTALEQAGDRAERLTVAVVGIADSDLPRRVLAGLTLLEARVHAIVRIGHDPRIRATGRPVLDRAAKPVRRAVAELTDAITATAPPTRVESESRCDVATRHTSPRPTPLLEKGHA